MILFEGKKIALFSDLHLGVGQNSPTRLQIAVDFIERFIQYCQEREVSEILFLGDFFHNRQSLDPRTLHVAADIIELLKDFHLVFLVGNHDAYYKNSSEITPIRILQRSNIQVISSEPQWITFKNFPVKALGCSWGTTLEQIKEKFSTTKKEDKKVCFGHFEIISFLENTFYECQRGFHPRDLLDIVDQVYSGHFHFPSQKEYKEEKKIVYIGSPFQLNFGDRQSERFFYFWDPQTLELEAIENIWSPKHYKVSVSEILQNPKKILSQIKGNFIEVIIDNPKEYEKKFLALTSLLKQSLYYKISPPSDSFSGFKASDVLSSFQEFTLSDLPSVFQTYIQESSEYEQKDKLLSYLLDIYRQAQDLVQEPF